MEVAGDGGRPHPACRPQRITELLSTTSCQTYRYHRISSAVSNVRRKKVTDRRGLLSAQTPKEGAVFQECGYSTDNAEVVFVS